MAEKIACVGLKKGDLTRKMESFTLINRQIIEGYALIKGNVVVTLSLFWPTGKIRRPKMLWMLINGISEKQQMCQVKGKVEGDRDP